MENEPMSSGGIDEVSQILGRLEAQMTTAVSQLDALSKKLGRLEADHAAMKNKGAGLLIGVGLLAGAVGETIKAKVYALLGL